MSVDMNKIGIGIIGSGFMGRTNAETIAKYLSGARLVAVTGGKRAAQLAADYQTDYSPSVPALLERHDVDAVFISTPHSEHAAHTIAAANAGKHVLIDKPMAATVEQCNLMIEAANRAGTNLMVMFGQRFRLVNQEAHRLIREGAIGRIRAIEACSLNSGGLAALPPWQSLPENLGTLFGYGVHSIDLIRWLTGDEISTVAARSLREETSRNEVSTMALLGLHAGAMATLWVSWAIPAPGFPTAALPLALSAKPAFWNWMLTACCGSDATELGPRSRNRRRSISKARGCSILSAWSPMPRKGRNFWTAYESTAGLR